MRNLAAIAGVAATITVGAIAGSSIIGGAEAQSATNWNSVEAQNVVLFRNPDGGASVAANCLATSVEGDTRVWNTRSYDVTNPTRRTQVLAVLDAMELRACAREMRFPDAGTP